jgi:hypothetical protein
LQAGSTVPANQNQFKTQIYGYGLKNLWDHCLTRPDTVSSLCEKPWALPITAKKMLLCDGQGLSVKTPKDGLGQDWFVLPSLSPDALNNHYKSKDECGQVDFLSPELWSDVLKVFWVDSVQRKFAQLDENPDPDYFFGSSAEENLGVRVT